jgi:hypothetical protein
VVYGRAYADLVAELGEPASGLVRFEYGRVALAQVNLLEASRALDAARWTRTHGKGRRPDGRAIECLSRRQALQDQSYSQALDRLRDLAKANGHGPDLAQLLADRRESSS